MNDTAPAVEIVYRRLLLARSGVDRLKMGCDMFDAAVTLARAGVRAAAPGATEERVRAEVFVRLYGGDFDAPTQARIVERLSRP